MSYTWGTTYIHLYPWQLCRWILYIFKIQETWIKMKLFFKMLRRGIYILMAFSCFHSFSVSTNTTMSYIFPILSQRLMWIAFCDCFYRFLVLLHEMTNKLDVWRNLSSHFGMIRLKICICSTPCNIVLADIQEDEETLMVGGESFMWTKHRAHFLQRLKVKNTNFHILWHRWWLHHICNGIVFWPFSNVEKQKPVK